MKLNWKLISLALMTILSSCIPYEVEEGVVESQPKPVLWVMVNDVTRSDPHLEIPPSFIPKLITKNAYRGIKIGSILISSNSSTQIPFITDLIHIDTSELTGNYIERSRYSKGNYNIKMDFHRMLDSVSRTINAITLIPKTEDWTDVDGALRLLKILTEEEQFSDYEINVLINSDLLQDLPQSQNPKPIIFLPKVKLYCLGASPKVNLSKLFPLNKVYLISNSQAITTNSNQ
jgi:hypothetical protein